MPPCAALRSRCAGIAELRSCRLRRGSRATLPILRLSCVCSFRPPLFRRSLAMSSEDAHLGWLQAAVRGDRAALLKLLSRSRAALVQRVSRRIPAGLRSTVDADDIVQNTHVEVVRRIGEFEAQDAGAFERWVATIAIHK